MNSLQLIVRDTHGTVVAHRTAHNQVLRNGARLIARLFTGQGGQAINQLQLGFATEESSLDATTLTPPQNPIDPATLLGPIAPETFTVDTSLPDLVRVSANVPFTPAVRLPDVSEAGLRGGDDLYNQVVFEPVTLEPGQTITFFWQIEFPFGH